MSIKLAMELIFAAKEDGGGTFYPAGVKLEDDAVGYVVGGKFPSLILRKETRLIEATELVAQWIDNNRPSIFYGSWADDGLIHFDAVDIISDLDVAMALGIEREQIALWDLENSVEIPVPVAVEEAA